MIHLGWAIILILLTTVSQAGSGEYWPASQNFRSCVAWLTGKTAIEKVQPQLRSQTDSDFLTSLWELHLSVVNSSKPQAFTGPFQSRRLSSKERLILKGLERQVYRLETDFHHTFRPVPRFWETFQLKRVKPEAMPRSLHAALTAPPLSQFEHAKPRLADLLVGIYRIGEDRTTGALRVTSYALDEIDPKVMSKKDIKSYDRSDDWRFIVTELFQIEPTGDLALLRSSTYLTRDYSSSDHFYY